MTSFENLVRLQTLLVLWPNERGRIEFKTELHLRKTVEDAYEEVFPLQVRVVEKNRKGFED